MQENSLMVKEEKEEPNYYTIDEFAAKLRIHHNTVRRWIKNGNIQAIKIGPKNKPTYRIDKTEIGRIAMFNLEETIERIIEDREKKKEIK